MNRAPPHGKIDSLTSSSIPLETSDPVSFPSASSWAGLGVSNQSQAHEGGTFLSESAAEPTLEEARERILAIYERARERAPALGGFLNSGATISRIEPGRITWAFFFPNHAAVFDRHSWLLEAFSSIVADEFGAQYTLAIECNPDAVNVHCFHAPVPPVVPESQTPISTTTYLAPVVVAPATNAAPVRRRRSARPDGFDYQRYLASRPWALLKEQVRERSGGFCEHCHAAPHQDTHHLTYERLGNESLSDLMALCRDCHAWVSAKKDENPLNKAWAISEPFQPARIGEFFHLAYPLNDLDSYQHSFDRTSPVVWFMCGSLLNSPFGTCQWCDASSSQMQDFIAAILLHKSRDFQ